MRFVSAAKERVGDRYAINIYFMDGANVMPLSRRRVWVHFAHRAVGGHRVHQRMTAMVRAIVSHRVSLGKAKLADVLLVDEDPKVQEHIAAIEQFEPHDPDTEGFDS